jgi:hypothetical protein
MLPSAERKELLGFWLAKAQKMFPGIRVWSICQMSSHGHFCLEDTDGSLSAFMRYFESNFARAINRLDHIRGSLFERRFAEIAIVDRDALPRRIAYAICNPVEASLVRSHEEWTGLCLYAKAEPTRHAFTLFHRHRHERVCEAARRTTGEYVDPNDFYETVELEVAGAGDELAAAIEDAIVEREKDLRAQQKGVLGMQRVLQCSPFDRPAMQSRTKMPLCFASTHELREAFLHGWCKFVEAFRAASKAFRSGFLTAAFPIFSFRPSTPAL